MIGLPVAEQLLDFGSRLHDPVRAREQLAGAVALHNLLETEKVAYLADEVGMGKTFVALGALALFRHFNPNFRVLVIAPRENIQLKWMKELRGFVKHNVRFADLRVKGLDDRPVRPMASCGNLIELLREVSIDRNQDFFMRMPSFSLGVSGKGSVDADSVAKLRAELLGELPWLDSGVFDLRNKQTFKDNVAKAICCALPKFDLVIIDEAHNLKHGFRDNVAARNRVLALALGHPEAEADPRLFPTYGERAARVLMLSATPLEDSYTQLWNQLHVFGRQGRFEALRRREATEEEKRKATARFLIRRVTTIRVVDQEHTKNLYRREWRHGGLAVHDEPITVADPRQRLTVALVQKKVAELLGHERFNASFQIGMLASFESFLQTAPLQRDGEQQTFDDTEQTQDAVEREGLDVADLNRLAASHRDKFGTEMAHPKMDAVVRSMSTAWSTGKKALVFVRRIGSVRELKAKLDELYDTWLMDRLRRDLPPEVQPRLEGLFARYRVERAETGTRAAPTGRDEGTKDGLADVGGSDTFFAWFFRGEGPRNVVSGANVQRRFIQASAAYATFFEDNVLIDVLACAPEEVPERLAGAVGTTRAALPEELRQRAAKFLGTAKKHGRRDQFRAAQAAAVEWLTEKATGEVHARAQSAWRACFAGTHHARHTQAPPDVADWLSHRTFFTELRERPELRARLWPELRKGDWEQSFRDRQLRAQLLASAARLGHAFIDLYVMTIRRLGSLELRTIETGEDAAEGGVRRVHEYLELLEAQRRTPPEERGWRAFDELAAIAENFELILDVNAPEARERSLIETAAMFSTLLRQQQPVGGMYGAVSQTLVRQFRMPGYPLVLVTTDLLQEGEDLHTFCSSVHHYGIAWAPSSMEQRTGRIDRVRSETDRRLASLKRPAAGEELLQVHFPYLRDTIEIVQVQRVLSRMDEFLRLMHEGLVVSTRDDRTVDARREFARGIEIRPQLKTVLRSAFPVAAEHVEGDGAELAVGPSVAKALAARFQRLPERIEALQIRWDPSSAPNLLLGTVQVSDRIQPFRLLLHSSGANHFVRCVSPVGRIVSAVDRATLEEIGARHPVRIGAIREADGLSYDLTIEDDVLLGNEAVDAIRVGGLIRHVTTAADVVERDYLGGDRDLSVFREDLIAEGTHGR